MSTRTRFAPTARSMAPPTAGGWPTSSVAQLARSPFSETWKPPSTVTSMWPPRIIMNESVWWKNEPPGTRVTGCLPALISSGSPSPGAGAGPIPRMPFSEW